MFIVFVIKQIKRLTCCHCRHTAVAALLTVCRTESFVCRSVVLRGQLHAFPVNNADIFERALACLRYNNAVIQRQYVTYAYYIINEKACTAIKTLPHFNLCDLHFIVAGLCCFLFW